MECAAKKGRSVDSFGKNLIVFSFYRQDCNKTIISDPISSGIDTYRLVLAFLNGADTVQKLAATEKSCDSPVGILNTIHSVVGGISKKAVVPPKLERGAMYLMEDYKGELVEVSERRLAEWSEEQARMKARVAQGLPPRTEEEQRELEAMMEKARAARKKLGF